MRPATVADADSLNSQVQGSRWTDPDYLRYQYGDAEKLRIRSDTHRRFTVWDDQPRKPDPFVTGLLRHLRPAPGLRLLDVGCGPGTFHRALRRLRIIGVDSSFGMLREAAQHSHTRCTQGDAQRLPIADRCVDRVMCNYVLFHVPDREAALREMRRVVRPGGRVVLTTNGATHLPRLDELHAEAARELGYTPTPPGTRRFTMDDLPLVQRVFPNAERHVLSGAVVFPDVESVLRYYATGAVDRLADPPADNSHRPRLLEAVRQRAAAIVAREGNFMDPKSAGWFVADT